MSAVAAPRARCALYDARAWCPVAGPSDASSEVFA